MLLNLGICSSKSCAKCCSKMFSQCNHGNALIRLGKLDEAAAKFEAALKVKADFEPARRGLARVAQARQPGPLVPNSPVPLP